MAGWVSNLQTVENDIAKGQGYVLTLNDEVITYAALIFNDEPAYENIKENGKH